MQDTKRYIGILQFNGPNIQYILKCSMYQQDRNEHSGVISVFDWEEGEGAYVWNSNTTGEKNYSFQLILEVHIFVFHILYYKTSFTK